MVAALLTTCWFFAYRLAVTEELLLLGFLHPHGMDLFISEHFVKKKKILVDTCY